MASAEYNKKQNEIARQKFEDLFKNQNEFILISEYINHKKKVLIKASTCGHIFSVRVDHFKEKMSCKICAQNHNPIIAKEKFNKIFQENKEFILLSEYINCKKRVKIKSIKCGHIFDITPMNFSRRVRCSVCNKATKENILKKIKLFFLDKMSSFYIGNEYELLSKYVDWYKKLSIRHIFCGNIFEVRADHFLRSNGTRCQCITISKGEKRIENFLIGNNIKFFSQYKFKDCIGKKRKLPFDFYLPNHNICIEYNGQQHFQNIWPKSYEKIKITDSIKRNYCKINNIHLIIIPFTKFDNIESVLKEEFNAKI